jgi:hypothetical protein
VIGCLAAAACMFAGLVGLTCWGMSLIREQVIADLERQPLIEEHLGLPLTCHIDYLKSGQDGRTDYFVYECGGPVDSGTVTLRSDSLGPDGEEVVVDAVLRCRHGTVVVVEP